MKRWIRPQGVLVFIVLLLLVAALSFLFSGSIVKHGIEKAGTSIVGARVDVGSARLSLSPLGLTVSGLQVTNPRRPMENTVQVDRIAFNMDSGALLRRKLLVQEMSLEGMAFNTPRRTSGAVTRPAREKAGSESENGIRFPSLKTPPVTEILAQEELVSVKRSRELSEKAATAERSVEDSRKGLPDRAKAAEYKKRLDRLLSDSGLSKARLEEAKTLQKEIRAERDRVQAAEERVTSSLSTLRVQMKETRGSVSEDVNRLKNKYALTPGGLANITRVLFGEKAGIWADRGVQALKLIRYLPARGNREPEKVRPPRGEGVDVPLPDRMALPDFWVKRAALSVRVPSGTLSGEALDFSSDQAVVRKPAGFRVSGTDLAGGASISASGILDHIKPTEPEDDFKISYDGWRVDDLVLSQGGNLPVTLRKGSGKLSGNMVLRGEDLDGSVRIDLSSVSLETGGLSDTSLARAMRAALQGVQRFSLTAEVGGTLDDPQIRLSSDLDRLLQDAVGQAAKEEADRLEAGLRTAIEAKTGPALADAQKSLQRIESARAELEAVRADLEDALKAKAAVKLPF